MHKLRVVHNPHKRVKQSKKKQNKAKRSKTKQNKEGKAKQSKATQRIAKNFSIHTHSIIRYNNDIRY